MPKECHNGEREGDGQGDGNEDSCSTPSQTSVEEAESPRKDSDQSCFQPLKEEAENTAPLTTRKKLTQKSFKGQNRVGQQHRRNKAPVLPPLKLLHAQYIASAEQRHIQQLNNEVWDLQKQLRNTVQENRLLQRLQSRHAAALQHFEGVQASLPQLLCNHSNEVRALQELLRRAKTYINILSRKLRSTESTLLHTRDKLHRLQRLTEDENLEERETLTQRLSVLAVDLDKKNKRIQDLETNFALSTALFNRQISGEMRKTTEARDQSRHLEDLISILTQKIKGMEKELANYEIYSHRFLKGSLKKGRKENKFAQTESLTSLALETPPIPLQIEYPQKDTWEVDANESSEDRSSEDERTRKEDEETSNETPPGRKENKFAQTDPLMSLGLLTPPILLQIEYPKKDTWEVDANESSEVRSSEDERTRKEDEETSNETPPDIGRTGGTDGIELEYSAGQEEITASLAQDLASEGPDLEETNEQLGVQNLVVTRSGSANRATKSPVKIKQQYTFKETILNLHNGIPAHGTSQRSGPRFHRCESQSHHS